MIGWHAFVQVFMFLFSYVQITSGQIKNIGLPYVTNFPKSVYNADTQNWEIIEGENGLIYIANNRGILQFDGIEWKVYPVSNNSIVRSLTLGSDGHIYAGAYNELGRLVENATGEMIYESLMDEIPEDYKEFDDIWKTFNTRYGIVFQGYEYVFIYNDGYFQVIKPEERFGFSFYINNNLYIIDRGSGLKVFDGKKLQPVLDAPVINNNEIRFILPHLSNELLIGTLDGEIYVLANNNIRKWNNQAESLLKEHKIFSAIKIGQTYALGSIKNGVYFLNEDGSIVQHINRRKGLQNNTILSLYNDRSNNIWMGLDNGIDYIKSSLPVSVFNYNYNIESTYASVVHNDFLYVGTNQGLVAKRLSAISVIDELEFKMIPNTEGQVWNLTVIDGTLFCGHTTGAFTIDGFNSERIFDGLGVWNFVKPSSDNNIIISGTYDGIIKFRKTRDGRWQFSNDIEGIDISVRDLTEDRSGNFWISHGYKGVYKAVINSRFNEIVDLKLYNQNHRLPSELPYFVHKINEQLFFSTRNGIYQYNMVQNNFLRPKNLNDFYKELDLIYKLHQDQEGNIWYFTETAAGVYKLLEDGTYVNISTPFKPLQNSLMASFSNINVHDRENIFIGTQDGLVHYNPIIEKNYLYEISAILKQVYISDSQKDSLWFEKGSIQTDWKNHPDRYTIPYRYNNIRFRFSSNDMENSGTSEFKIRLLGFSDTWSDWNQINDKEYTKLREGNYRFEVLTRNIYGNVSEITGFNFIIKPPFYRTVLAYILYAMILLSSTTFTIIYVIRRIEKARRHEKIKQQAKYEEKTQKLREENILAEQELIRLRNEQLTTNMKHKTKELANATYYIIQKNKFLNKLKNDLSGLSNKAKSELVEEELKKISRKIDRDIHHDQNWKVFNKYFDEVHQDFLVKLKEKHPDLTPKDLRLCGYLRMNISTKEIAPLLNISVRGVEISRYRLRRKLSLERDDNLIEYLMKY